MWQVYFLYSTKSKITYVGISEDPKRRLLEHNNHKSKFTSAHTPWIIYYQESCSSLAEAREKEKYYKSTGRFFVKQKLREFLNE
jgi:putative endonuclease